MDDNSDGQPTTSNLLSEKLCALLWITVHAVYEGLFIRGENSWKEFHFTMDLNLVD